ncbi:MAG: hypothetical protein IKZ91_02860 [Bacteroidales bacterium]|nr:hypothetical protein [Bacteroidales bacterium]
MKVKYRIWIALAAALVLAGVGIRLLFVPAAFKYGLILIGAVALGFLVWKAFIKTGQDELKRSEAANEKLTQELATLQRRFDELSHSPLNVTSLTPVLHLAVLNIDTSFTRTYVREDDSRGLRFNGALRADICAEYGIRLEDVRFRLDEETDTLWLSDFRPGLLSFSKKQLEWTLAVALRKRSVLGIQFPPVDDKTADDFTREMKERIRSEVEKEIDERRIAEFEWLAPIVSRQVTDVLRAAIGRPGAKVQVLETPAAPDAGFLPLADFYSKLAQ